MGSQKRMVLSLVAVAWLSVSVAGAPQGDYSRGILDREQVLASAAGITRHAYPNADRVHVDDFTLCEYQPDGTGITWSDNYTKVLTEKGRRQKQALTFNFLLPYTTVAVTRLELIKPDGAVVPIDVKEQGKVMIDHSQMSGNTYNPNSKILQVGVPGLQIDDVIHLVTRHETLRRVMPNTWDDYQVFESVAPIKHATYEVHAPRERPLCSMALKDPVAGTVTDKKYERDGQIIYRWEISDVPRFYREPGMPPSYTVIQRLLVSTLSDWRAISRWYWRLCEPHLDATTPQMQDMVDRLTEGVTDRWKRIEAIFFWVSQQVRYMGITTEHESPGWEPHDVRMTFESRHGVCRDKAALLVAMLRLAGIEAYPVLVGLGPKRDIEVPVVNFHHAIVGVQNDDGSYQLMDCTDENTQDLLPSYLCNQSYLVARPEGEILQTSPVVPAEKNMILVEITGEVDAQGNLTAEADLAFNGINDNVHRGYLARATVAERQRHFEGLLKASIGTAKLTEFALRPANMQDMTEPLSVRLGFTVKDLLTGDGTTFMMPLPHCGTKASLLYPMLGQMGLAKRRFPLQMYSTWGNRETLHLKVDPAAASFSSLPECAALEDETISWKCRFEHRANALQAESEFLLKVVEFGPREYGQLKQSLKRIERNERKMPILTRASPGDWAGADIVVLDDWVEYNLIDARNWTERHRVTKKILTYKGKKDSAELKLDYNPVWEDVRLIRASVDNNGSVQEISEQEINLMDAAWAAAAPRYPGGKALVASLPTVEIGSVITYEYERLNRNHPFFALTHVFRGFHPVLQQTVKLTAPASLALQIVRDDNGVSVPDDRPASPVKQKIVENTEHRGDQIVRQWTAQDQAPVIPEDLMPPLYSFCPTLRITTGDWRIYAKDTHAALCRMARGQAAAERRAREVAQGAQEVREKIIAIRDLVAKNIRAAGPVFGQLPPDAICAADRTLADGYGNLTDRAVLLYSMLEAVQLSPEFVLVSGGPPIESLHRFDAQYPSAGTFDGVLVRLRCGSAEIYLNDTDQYAVLGATPAHGHLALSLAQGQTETVSVTPDRRDLGLCEYRLGLTAQGDASMVVTQSWYGNSFAERRKMFTEMRPEERDRYYHEMVAEISSSAAADGNLVTDFNSYPGVESFSVQMDGYAVRDGVFLYFELPAVLRSLFGLRSDRRENPFCFGRERHVRSFAIIELPREFPDVVLIPEDKEWLLPGRGGTVRVSLQQDHTDDGSAIITLAQEVDLSPFILDAGDYADLAEAERQLSHARGRMILLARRD